MKPFTRTDTLTILLTLLGAFNAHAYFGPGPGGTVRSTLPALADPDAEPRYLYREYQPREGRWTSRDPIGEHGFILEARNQKNLESLQLQELRAAIGSTDPDFETRFVSTQASGQEAGSYCTAANSMISHTDKLGLTIVRPPRIPGIWAFFFPCPNLVCDKFSYCIHIHAPCLRAWPAHPIEHAKCVAVAWRKLTQGCITGDSAMFREGCEQRLACHLQFFHGD